MSIDPQPPVATSAPPCAPSPDGQLGSCACGRPPATVRSLHAVGPNTDSFDSGSARYVGAIHGVRTGAGYECSGGSNEEHCYSRYVYLWIYLIIPIDNISFYSAN
jgi:hypothetical protein